MTQNSNPLDRFINIPENSPQTLSDVASALNALKTWMAIPENKDDHKGALELVNSVCDSLKNYQQFAGELPADYQKLLNVFSLAQEAINQHVLKGPAQLLRTNHIEPVAISPEQAALDLQTAMEEMHDWMSMPELHHDMARLSELIQNTYHALNDFESYAGPLPPDLLKIRDDIYKTPLPAPEVTSAISDLLRYVFSIDNEDQPEVKPEVKPDSDLRSAPGSAPGNTLPSKTRSIDPDPALLEQGKKDEKVALLGAKEAIQAAIDGKLPHDFADWQLFDKEDEPNVLETFVMEGMPNWQNKSALFSLKLRPDDEREFVRKKTVADLVRDLDRHSTVTGIMSPEKLNRIETLKNEVHAWRQGEEIKRSISDISTPLPRGPGR